MSMARSQSNYAIILCKRKIEQLELILSLIVFNDHENVQKELCVTVPIGHWEREKKRIMLI